MSVAPLNLAGNRIFLVCTACGADTDHAFELARRTSGGYRAARMLRDLQAWLDRHENCGGTRDHFKAGLAKSPDWDATEIADPKSNVRAAVRLGIAKA